MTHAHDIFLKHFHLHRKVQCTNITIFYLFDPKCRVVNIINYAFICEMDITVNEIGFYGTIFILLKIFSADY